MKKEMGKSTPHAALMRYLQDFPQIKKSALVVSRILCTFFCRGNPWGWPNLLIHPLADLQLDGFGAVKGAPARHRFP